MIVMKFGGTSLGNAERIRKTADIVKFQIDRHPVVVVSAVAKTTDALIKLANEASNGRGNDILENIRNIHHKILSELNIDNSLLEEDLTELSHLVNETRSAGKLDARILDCLQSFGERMSSKIVAAHLNKQINSKAFNSWELGFLTTNNFGNAEPLEASYSSLKSNIAKLDAVAVVTGFIGKAENGEITTLGRGGSDYSAAVIGAAIDAEEIQIWTDVNGIMSTDPKIVPNAKPIRQVSFAEAAELAYFGAKVLHPKTILPAMRRNIPVRVLNSFNPEDRGTTIVSKPVIREKTVKAIACKNNSTLIHIDSTRMLGAYGFLAKIFEIFSKYRKSVDVISTSEVSVSLTVDNGENVDSIIRDLKEIGEVEVAKNKSVICVVGEGMKDTLGIPAKIFSTLAENEIHIEMISMGASEINITFIVDGKDTEQAVKALHKEYFGE